MSEAEPDSREEAGRLERRTDLMFLPQVAAGLRDTLAASELSEEDWESACASSITARCSICETELNGDDWAHWLLRLGVEEETEKRAMKFIRLEKGTCADLKCNARFYQLSFEPHPAVDWSAVYIGGLKTEAPPQKSYVGEHVATAAVEGVRRQLTARVGIGLGILMVLWIFHQYYTGGEIPVLRPAKQFEARPDPTNQFDLNGR